MFTISILEENNFEFPEKIELDKRLKDILEDKVDESFFLSTPQVERLTKSTYNQGKAEIRIQGEIARTLCARDYKDPKCVAQRGRENSEGKIEQKLEPRKDEATNTITTVQKDNLIAQATELQREVCDKAIEKGLVEPNDVIEYTFSNARLEEIESGRIKKQNSTDNKIMSTLKTRPQSLGITIRTANKQGYDIAEKDDAIDLAYPNSETRRGRVGHGVAKTLAIQDSMGTFDGIRIRKLTPKECWRLMGFDDSDFEKAEKVNSNTQLYKQAGNSIVVDVLQAITKNLLKGEQSK